MTLVELVYYLKLFRNDIYHIHTHSAGPDFDKVHLLTEELYKELDEEIDDIAEMGISEGLELQNFTLLKSVVSDWAEENNNAYFLEDFINVLSEKGKIIIDSITNTDTKNIAHEDYLNEVLQFWDKQINYKNELRKLIPQTYVDAHTEIQDEEFIPDNSDAEDLENLQTDLIITNGIQIDPLASQMFTSPYEKEENDN